MCFLRLSVTMVACDHVCVFCASAVSLCSGACAEVDSDTEAVAGQSFKLGCISCKKRGEVEATATVDWMFRARGEAEFAHVSSDAGLMMMVTMTKKLLAGAQKWKTRRSASAKWKWRVNTALRLHKSTINQSERRVTWLVNHIPTLLRFTWGTDKVVLLNLALFFKTLLRLWDFNGDFELKFIEINK